MLGQPGRRERLGDAAHGEDQAVVRNLQVLVEAAVQVERPELEVDALDDALQDLVPLQGAVQRDRDPSRIQATRGDLRQQRAVTEVVGRADDRQVGGVLGQLLLQGAGREEPREAAADHDHLRLSAMPSPSCPIMIRYVATLRQWRHTSGWSGQATLTTNCP